MTPSLVLLLLIPIAGAIIGALLPHGRAPRLWALIVSLLTLAVGAYLAFAFQQARPTSAQALAQPLGSSIRLHFGPAGEQSPLRFSGIGSSISFGVDAVSLWLVLLTVFITPLAIAASFESIQDRAKEYYAWMLVLLAAMLGVFISRDLLLFYVFFELTLVPMFFIIGIWGGPDRRYAAAKFFLFTFAGSVLTLAAAIFLGLKAGHGRPSFDINDVILYAQSLPADTRKWLVLGLLAGFAVKVPLFPVHTWLPLAHTEAPTAGSVILAGVLLKLGTYGIFRLAVPIGLIGGTSEFIPYLIHVIGALCIIGIIYGALVAWVQQDIKKLVAYSSVSHLGFCVLGLMALNPAGMQGSVLYMINHGLSTGAMFLVIGMIYERYHTRDINELSGLARRMPILAFFFILFTMSSIGLPGLNGFVSEFLTVFGAFVSPHLGRGYGTFAALGVILGAVYMLHMAARVIWGPLKTPAVENHGSHDTSALSTRAGQPLHGASGTQQDQGQSASPGHDDAHHGSGAHHTGHPTPGDIGPREIAILVPLAIAVILLGVVPKSFLVSIYQPVVLAATPALPEVNPASPDEPAPRVGGYGLAPKVTPETRAPKTGAAVSGVPSRVAPAGAIVASDR